MRNLGRSLEVIGIGIHVNHTVGVFLEDIRACSHRCACLGLHAGKVTLYKTEFVVVIVIKALITIVMHGSDGNRELVNHGSVNLRSYDTHGVISCTLDTGNVGSGFAGLNTHLISGIHIAPDASACCFAVGKGIVISLICFQHCIKEIGNGSALRKSLKAPVGSDGLNRIGSRRITLIYTVVKNGLSKSISCCRKSL